MPVQIQLKAYADAVNSRLQQLLPPADAIPAQLHGAMRYSCLAPGKRLRPALCMACAEAVGAVATDVLDAACAVEMIHCFSLIHDDLPAIDNDDLRRGLPTCHKKYGEAIAILAGDALFSLAFQTLADSHAPADRVVKAMRLLTAATGSDGLVGGEVVDVVSEGQTVDAETLRFIHSRKTGALIGAACEIGSLLGGGSAEDVAALKLYGEQVGLAFQIADDILNETGSSARLGKSVGTDRERQKATYVALYGLDEAREAALTAARSAESHLGQTGDRTFLRDLARFTIERLH